MNTYTPFGCNVQFGEATLDKMYQDCFGYKTDGVFVEIGANDGMAFSHTYALAKLGWRGVYVEPVPSLVEQCRANHKEFPAVTVLGCAAGDYNGEASLFVDVPTKFYHGGSLNGTVAPESRMIKVPQRTLDSILETEQILPGFDLLSIDVEFGEMQVFKGFDLARWVPKMVIVELCEKHGGDANGWAKPARDYCETYFPEHSYRKAYADAINTVFIHESCRDR